MLEIVFDGKPCRIMDAALPGVRCGAYRSLNETEERVFRNWALAQAHGVKVDAAWHPVVQDELLKIRDADEVESGHCLCDCLVYGEE